MAKNSKPRRPATQSIAALCIGGMIVARTVADTELADELRASCLTVARGIGGWDKNTGGKSRKSRRR
jgi:TetR/AcrR family transcriptional regulator, transcriptional repressor for nem operon